MVDHDRVVFSVKEHGMLASGMNLYVLLNTKLLSLSLHRAFCSLFN